MKKKTLITAMLLATLSASMLLSGCRGGGQTTAQPAQAEPTQAPAAVTQVPTQAPAAVTQVPTLSAGTAADTSAASAQAPAADSQISVEKAKEIALGHAAVNESDVVYKKAELDMDDGVTKYDVDFYCGDTEYEYDIDAATGNILSFSSDAMDAEDRAEMEAIKNRAGGNAAAPANQAGGNAAAPADQAGGITEDQALEIALSHAGVTRDSATQVSSHLDFDDDTGLSHYDVEFNVGNTEYSYDIDPDNGSILSFDSDIDD